MERIHNLHSMRAGLRGVLLAITLLALLITPASVESSEADHSLYLPIAVDTTPHCTHRPPEHIFGVQMYGETGPRNRFYEPLVESGAAWLRVPILWKNIEPSNTTPDKYIWRHADNAVAAATHQCVEIILTFSLAPGWVTQYGQGVIPENMHKEAAEFLAAVVERYDGDGINDAPVRTIVNHIEMYNEPDGRGTPDLSNWGRHGATYAKLLAAVTPKMKQANPQVKVLFGGIAYDWFTTDNPSPGNFIKTFLDDVIAGGGGPYFDIMNFHYYTGFAWRWTDQGPGLLQKTEALREKLDDLGVTGKPFMVTETGWFNDGSVSGAAADETHMRYMVQLLTQAKAADLQALIYYPLSDSEPSAPYYPGLVTSGHPPVARQAMSTFQMIVEVLGPARFDRVVPNNVTGASDMEVYEFTDTRRKVKVYVAWLDPINTSAKKSLVLSGEQATVRNVRDVRSHVADTNDGQNDGRLTFEVTASPILIEIPQ